MSSKARGITRCESPIEIALFTEHLERAALARQLQ